MHKDLYAGGFLFHPGTNRILLQQYTSTGNYSSSWSLFGSQCLEQDNPTEIFKKTILHLLNLKISKVFSVYSYINEHVPNRQSIMYSEIKQLKNFPSKNGFTFAWVSFKDVLKLECTNQMKRDIVVGQRVIEAAIRKSEEEIPLIHTLT